ncbi:MAG: site-specific integrase [Clostridia bacterium]|nr:site-specific integrase [Clostridia bacterium]
MEQKIIIRKRKSAKLGTAYEYRFEAASISGQRKWISKSGFKTEKLARTAGLKAMAQYYACGEVAKPSTMSFADFLDYWIDNDCKAILNETTIDHYQKKIKNLITPTLGGYRLSTISRDKLQSLLTHLHDNGYAYNTLISIKGILTKCFNYALLSGHLTKSPAINLKIPKSENTSVPTRLSPHVYLSQEQITQIFDRFPITSPAHLPLKIGLHCGLRIGEAFALTWDDVDFEQKKISINKQIQWRQFKRTSEQIKQTNGKATEDAGRWYFSSTKYKSDRVIDIDDELLHLLKQEKENQTKAEQFYDKRYARYYLNSKREITQNRTNNEIRFVFVREDGTYITPRTMHHTSRIIHYQLNIKEFDYHSLRHTHATKLLEHNAPLKYIQHRLGHKKLDITLNVYQHLTDTLKAQGANTLNQLFTQPQPTAVAPTATK